MKNDRIIAQHNGRWALLEPDWKGLRALLYKRSNEPFHEFEKRCSEYGKPKKEKAPKKEIIIKFKRWTCKLAWEQYGNGRTALQLIDAEDGELVATATVNLPHIQIAPDEVIIKDYSENDGLLNVLVKAGIVEDTGRKVKSGYVDIPVCRFLKKD